MQLRLRTTVLNSCIMTSAWKWTHLKLTFPGVWKAGHYVTSWPLRAFARVQQFLGLLLEAPRCPLLALSKLGPQSILLRKELWPPCWLDELCGNKARGSTYRMWGSVRGFVSVSAEAVRKSKANESEKQRSFALRALEEEGLPSVFSFSLLFPHLNTGIYLKGLLC